MSICDNCIHDYVCGLEDNHEEGIVSCADMIPKDVLDKIKAEIEEQKECRCFDDDDMYIYMTGLNDAIDIIDKHKAESEEV